MENLFHIKMNKGFRRVAMSLYRILSKFYVFIFARPAMQPANNVILQLAIRGQGYNNAGSPEATGESLFVERIAKMDLSVCLDVGANKGHYSKVILSKTDAIVYAFEPLPVAFESLKKLEESFPRRFVPQNVGVGSKNDTLELWHGAADSELASFSSEVRNIDYVGRENINCIKVPVITLDSFYDDKLKRRYQGIDLLKIDTEGFEVEVLQGAQRMIAEMAPKIIQIEYNWHQLFKNQSLRALSMLMPSYVPFQMLPYGAGLIKRNLDRPESNIYHFSNFVFIRGDVSV